MLSELSAGFLVPLIALVFMAVYFFLLITLTKYFRKRKNKSGKITAKKHQEEPDL